MPGPYSVPRRELVPAAAPAQLDPELMRQRAVIQSLRKPAPTRSRSVPASDIEHLGLIRG